jgi:hypothetical protein
MEKKISAVIFLTIFGHFKTLDSELDPDPQLGKLLDPDPHQMRIHNPAKYIWQTCRHGLFVKLFLSFPEIQDPDQLILVT